MRHPSARTAANNWRSVSRLALALDLTSCGAQPQAQIAVRFAGAAEEAAVALPHVQPAGSEREPLAQRAGGIPHRQVARGGDGPDDGGAGAGQMEPPDDERQQPGDHAGDPDTSMSSSTPEGTDFGLA